MRLRTALIASSALLLSQLAGANAIISGHPSAAAAPPRRVLQASSSRSAEGDTVIFGVIDLFTSEGLDACTASCATGVANAFGVNETSVGCACPDEDDDTSASRRQRRLFGQALKNTITSQFLLGGGPQVLPAESRGAQGRSLRGLAALEQSVPVGFSARVAGGIEGGAVALDLLSTSGREAVASALGVEESEVEFSTLTVTVPSSPDANETLTVITNFFDADDIPLLPLIGDDPSWAGGIKGVALFLSLLVLLAGTACCGCLILCIAWKTKYGRSMKTHGFPEKTAADQIPRRSDPSSNSNEGSPTSSSYRQPLVDSSKSASSPHHEAGQAVERGGVPGLDPRSKDYASTASAVAAGAAVAGAGGAAVAGTTAPYAGDEAGGSSSMLSALSASGAASVSEDPNTSSSLSTPARRGRTGLVPGPRYYGASGGGGGGGGVGTGAVAGAAAAAVAGGEGGADASSGTGGGDVSQEANPLYKSVSTLSRSAQEAPPAIKTETPGRSRLGFLGNATPARLRRLANRMAARSPALSGVSRRSKRSTGSRGSRGSRSGSSSRSHRRQGTFPGAYSQRNSSELDHQRPPADPVYTFMIKTIAAKGFKFMTTTEIAFCAMRMYSHFRRTEGNYKRLAVMKNAENVPPVYEIIWLSDASTEQLSQGDSRFFSSSKGTDAEQQKSLLACLLALSWNGSKGSRRTLQRALTPFKHTKVPAPEDIFWDDFQLNTDALSGDDQMVALARVILLVAESSNKPSPDSWSEGSRVGTLTGVTDRPADENGIEHGDVMQALSGAHLREIGITIKEARPGWQEAHVQLVSVLLVIAFLEEGAKNSLPGGERPDPLSSLEWVSLLTPEALDAFLVEKLEARRALVELDLEPSGLVIKHDDEGEVERVEPAMVDKAKHSSSGSWIGSRGHQQILPKNGRGETSRSRRSHRRSRSTESAKSSSSKTSHSPVVITTVLSRRHSRDSKAAASRGASSGVGGTVDSASLAGTVGSGVDVDGDVATPAKQGFRGTGGGGGKRVVTPLSGTRSSRKSRTPRDGGGSSSGGVEGGTRGSGRTPGSGIRTVAEQTMLSGSNKAYSAQGGRGDGGTPSKRLGGGSGGMGSGGSGSGSVTGSGRGSLRGSLPGSGGVGSGGGGGGVGSGDSGGDGGGSGGGGGGGTRSGYSPTSLRISAEEFITPGSGGRSRGSDGAGGGGASSRGDASQGRSPVPSDYHMSEASSVVTRVYAPSSAAGDDQTTFARTTGGGWAIAGSVNGRKSPYTSTVASPVDDTTMSQVSIAGSRFLTSPPPGDFSSQFRGASLRSTATGVSAGTAGASVFDGDGPLGAAAVAIGGGGGRGGNVGALGGVGAIGAGVGAREGVGRGEGAGGEAGAATFTDAGSGYGSPTIGKIVPGFSQDLTGVEVDDLPRSELARSELAGSPTGYSETGRSDTGFSEAASRYEPTPTRNRRRVSALGTAAAANAGLGPGARASSLGLDLGTLTSAAGSRFDGSPSSRASFMSRVGGGASPTSAGRGGGRARLGAAPYTGRSVASSIRSDTNSSFFKSGSSRSVESRARVSSASASSWDDEDLQNMGAQWLSERAYNQKFDEQK